jgi:hypothetical protein
MAAMAEGAGEPELVSIPATPRGLSTPEGLSTPPVRRGGAATSGAGTPVRRVVEGLRGYLEEVGHLTRLNPQDAWLPITESRSGNARYAAFHSLNAGLGFQALLIPLAFPALGWYMPAPNSPFSHPKPPFFLSKNEPRVACFRLTEHAVAAYTVRRSPLFNLDFQFLVDTISSNFEIERVFLRYLVRGGIMFTQPTLRFYREFEGITSSSLSLDVPLSRFAAAYMRMTMLPHR